MGIGGFFKKLFTGAEETLEGEFEESDEELRALWQERGDFDAVNLNLLRLEFALRGLPIPADRPNAKPSLSPVDAALVADDEALEERDVPELASDALRVVAPSAVLLPGNDGELLVALLPWWNPETPAPDVAAALGAGERVGGLLVLPGVRDAAAIASALGLAPEAVVTVGEGELPATLAGVEIERLDAEHPTVALTTSEHRVVVGAQIDLTSVVEPLADFLVGGITWPDTEEGLAALVECWEDDHVGTLCAAWVLHDAADVAVLHSRLFLEGLGIHTYAVGHGLPASLSAQPLVAAALTEDAEALAAGGLDDAPPDTLADAAGWLIFEDRLDAAAWLLDVAVAARGELGALLFARGELARLSGDADAARGHFEAATKADPPYERAWINLTHLAEAGGDPDGAFANAEAAAKALTTTTDGQEGDDGDLRHPIAVHNRALTLWRAGRRDDAVAVVQQAGLALSGWQRSLLEVTPDEGDPQVHPIVVRGARFYVGVAYEAAHWLRARNGTDPAIATARRLFERCVALDPGFAEAIAELHDLMWRADERDAAMALLDEALERQPLMAALHSLRGERRHGRGDLEGATDDYRRAIELVPELNDVLGNLGLVLIDAGADAGFEEIVDELMAREVNQRFINALRRVQRVKAAQGQPA